MKKNKMFSSLKLNSLKCQSNSGSEKKKDKCDENDDDDDDVSEHMYEKLPNYDSNTCKCHSNYKYRSPKILKTSFSNRISKWRMECPTVSNLKISHPSEETESKSNHFDRRELFNTKASGGIRTKVMTVSVEREDGNLGITLRGGFQQNVDLSKPVTITYVRPDGPAAREGTIKCGDRLIAVDGIPLQGRSLSEAQTLLRQPTPSTLLTIEYDVNVLDSVEHANGPLLIELELNSLPELGLTLVQTENGIVIGGVKPGSLADRSGALHAGDEILAVNSTRIDCTVLTVEEVMKFIEHNCPILRLEILPCYASLVYSDIGTWRSKASSKEHVLSNSTISDMSTMKSHSSKRNQDCKSSENFHELDLVTGSSPFHGSNLALTHSETIHTTLYRESGGFGLECVDAPDGTVIISNVVLGSPAERSQCLQPGDRILSVNNRSIELSNLTAKDVNELFEGNAEKMYLKLNLLTEFDVLDSVVPASGIFTVKLAKRGTSGLGITITASKVNGFIVCEMKKGSIAYRAGSLNPGDKILAINNILLNQCSVEYAAHILHQSSKVVTLRVQRKDHNNSDNKNSRKVTYTVELQRYGGPLGITIAGSEEPYHPITISGLTSGGLADQTGVLHVGDEILAINNHDLFGEPLSKAHNLLQNSPDFVVLKISRNITPYCRFSNDMSPILPSSVDSAVESWDSSRLDLAPSPEYQQKGHRDSRDCSKRNMKAKHWPANDGNLPDETTNDILSSNLADQGETIPDLSLLDEITSENLKIKKELDLLSLKLDQECKLNLGEESRNGSDDQKTKPQSPDVKTANTLNLVDRCEFNVNYMQLNHNDILDGQNNAHANESEDRIRESLVGSDFENLEIAYLADSKNWMKSHYLGNETNQESVINDFHNSQLYKVTLYKDPIYEDFGFSVSDGLYERGVFINRIRKGGPADLNSVLKPYDRILQVNDTYTQDFDCCLTVPLIASAGDSITLLIARNSGGISPDHELEDVKIHNKSCHSSSTLKSFDHDLEGSHRILV